MSLPLTREDWLSAKATGYLFSIFLGDGDEQNRRWEESLTQPDLARVLDSVLDQVLHLIVDHATGGPPQ